MGSCCRKYVCCCCFSEEETPYADRYTYLGLRKKDPSEIIRLYEKEPLVSLEEALAPFQGKIPNLTKKIQKAKQQCHYPSSDGLTRDESAAIYIYSDGSDSDSVFGHLRRALESNDTATIKPWLKYLKLLYTGVHKCPDTNTVWQAIPYDKSWDNHLRSGSAPTYTGFGVAARTQRIVQDHLHKKKADKMIFVEYDGVAKDVSRYTVDKSGGSMLIPGLKVLASGNPDVLNDGSIAFHLVPKKNPPAVLTRPMRTASPVTPKNPDPETKHFVCQSLSCKNRCHRNHDLHHCVGFFHIHDGCSHHCGEKNRCKRCKEEKHDLRQCNRCGEHYCQDCCMQ